MFDPYHKWLAIPPDQRPPTHYQLLAVSPAEKDPEVIEEAALQRIAHLRSYQIGPHAKECTRLLNEIAQAKVVLLNPAKRQEYDAQLARDAAERPCGGAARGSRRWLVAAAAATACVLVGIVITILASNGAAKNGKSVESNQSPENQGSGKSEPVKPALQDVIWFDDGLPEGAKLAANTRIWQWGDASTQPVLSGTYSLKASGEGHHARHFHAATQALSIRTGDVLFAYVWLDPKDPPQAIMLQFYDGNRWDHRAYWGGDLCEAQGDRDAPHHRYRGELPPSGKWTRLEVAAEAIGYVPDTKITGVALNQFGGTAYYDKIGISTIAPDEALIDDIAAPKKKKGKKK
jgi:hypothetical protein